MKRRIAKVAAATAAAAVVLVGLNAGDAASAATTVVDDRVTGTGDSQHHYSSGWLLGGHSGMWQSTDHYTNTAGATVRFRFFGTDVQLTGSRAADLGTARISIDGGAPVTVSQRKTGPRQDDVVFFDANGTGALANGQHTLTLTTTSNSPFTLDRTRVTTRDAVRSSPAGATRSVEETAT
jgi:hypothetical protein